MKWRGLALIVTLLLGVWLPGAASAVAGIRRQNPCGMLVCCCPEMCKMAKAAKKFVCFKEDGTRCGSALQRKATPVPREAEQQPLACLAAEPIPSFSTSGLIRSPLTALLSPVVDFPERPPSA